MVTDFFFVFDSPDGQKFRSKPQLQAHFGDKLDLTEFDFRTGGHIPTGKKKRTTRAGSPRLRAMRGLPKNKTPPSRVICGLVRQPVTCVLPQSHDFRKTTPPDISMKTDVQPLKPLPQQRFCMKRLDRLVVYGMDGCEVQVVDCNKVNADNEMNGDTMDDKESSDLIGRQLTDASNSVYVEDKIPDVGTSEAMNGGDQKKPNTSAPSVASKTKMSQALLDRLQQESPAVNLSFLTQPAAGGYSHHVPATYRFPVMHNTVGYPHLLPYHVGAVGHSYPPVYSPGHPMFQTQHAGTDRFHSFQRMPVEWGNPPAQSRVVEQADSSLEIAEEEVRRQEERVRVIRQKLEAARLKSGHSAI